MSGGPERATSSGWSRVRFLASWALALCLVGVGIPRVLDTSWHGVLPMLSSLSWRALLGATGLWLLGLLVHTFVLTGAAPSLNHRRALTLNLTGSAVANLVPLGGAAGVELNRRMMGTWGIDTRGFAGFTLLTNLWDVAAKLLLPVVAVFALAYAGDAVGPTLRLASLVGGVAFAVVALLAAGLLRSPRVARTLGAAVERMLRPVLTVLRRREPDVTGALLDLRNECAHLIANGWLRMSLGICGYLVLQAMLLGLCLHLVGADMTWPEVLAGFAVERLLTVLPVTPGGVGVADLGLVGVLLALGGDPVGVTAAAVLYRVFVFAAEIPVGGGALGLWLLGRQLVSRRAVLPVAVVREQRRVAHVTDVYLPHLGGIETHVGDLVASQRARGLDAHVLTPRLDQGDDPAWVHRIPAREARRVVIEYDVLHVHLSMLSPYGIAVARAAMRAGVPTLVTIHSMWAGAGGIVRLAALTALRRWPVAWSAVSGAAADIFRRSLGGAPVAVLPNAVDVNHWRPTAAENVPAVPSTEGPRGPVTVVTVMRLMPRKRPLALLRMFRTLREQAPGSDVRLVLVGDGPLRHRVDRYIARHGLGDLVRVTGRLPRHEVRGVLLDADVFVAPAPKESFGIAALEARCAGLPVVAHRRSGIVEFIRDRVDGLLVADDAEMASALAELVRDEPLRHRITAHNRSQVPAFDWSDVHDRTLTLYRVAGVRARVHADQTVTAAAALAEG